MMNSYQSPAPFAPVDPTKDLNFEPKAQVFAFTLAIFFLICNLLLVIKYGMNTDILSMVGSIFTSIFFLLILTYPKYVGGNPAFHKLWPVIIGRLLKVVSLFFGARNQIIGGLFFASFSTLIMYFAYIRDDTVPSKLLCCKPWIYIPKVAVQGEQKSGMSNNKHTHNYDLKI